MKKYIFVLGLLHCFLFACQSDKKQDSSKNEVVRPKIKTIPSELIIGDWKPNDMAISRMYKIDGSDMLSQGKYYHSKLIETNESFVFTDKEVYYNNIHVANWEAYGYSLTFTDKDSLHKSPIPLDGLFNVSIYGGNRMQLSRYYSPVDGDKIMLTFFLNKVIVP